MSAQTVSCEVAFSHLPSVGFVHLHQLFHGDDVARCPGRGHGCRAGGLKGAVAVSFAAGAHVRRCCAHRRALLCCAFLVASFRLSRSARASNRLAVGSARASARQRGCALRIYRPRSSWARVVGELLQHPSPLRHQRRWQEPDDEAGEEEKGRETRESALAVQRRERLAALRRGRAQRVGGRAELEAATPPDLRRADAQSERRGAR